MGIKKYISLITAAALTLAIALPLQSCKKEIIEETAGESAEETTLDAAQPVGALTDPLTGAAGYDAKYENSKPIGIVVENHPQARPQWGFTTPDMVMEYEVEGGISRMLWLYSNIDKVPAKIGPVRSARHDVVELAMGMDMLFVHCGGSDIALNLIKQYSSTITELDGLTYGSCFYRDQTRNVSKEHTLVMTGDAFRQSVADLGLSTELKAEYKNPFTFSASPRELTGGSGEAFHFEYSNSYKYDFRFNAESGKYTSTINGKACTDENNVPCAYTNVIVLYVDMIDLGDSSGHQDLLLEKGGKGLYVSGGKYEEISWQKGEKTDMLKLLAADGSPLALNSGNSYIGFVRSTQQGKTTVG